MAAFLEALSNRARLACDAVSGSLLDAQLLYQLREAQRQPLRPKETSTKVFTLLEQGACANAKSIWASENATDLGLALGEVIAQHLLDAGGKPTRAGIIKLANEAVWALR
jgi:hypothetical protein